jgi:hypothetical protein
LVELFAEWFGEQPHPHKVIIAGNHDSVLQAMGEAVVREVFTRHCTSGHVAYLEHQHASVGQLRVFGSPFGNWGSHNNGFFSRESDWSQLPREGTHIVITHLPPILPLESGRYREDKKITDALHRCGALLQVGGHCHWAHGLYHSRYGTPCVVASVCDSDWKSPKQLGLPRGDKSDLERGGYDLFFPVIVADLAVPPPPSDAEWMMDEGVQIAGAKPALLFFGPPTDPEVVGRLTPALSKRFVVHHFEDAAEAINFLQSEGSPVLAACIAKLGSKGNLGANVMGALRQAKQGHKTFLVVHSATACASPETQDALRRELMVDLFVNQESEAVLLKSLGFE